jgi:predicted DsbA family dithiol-disulfide isomerase
MPVEVRYYTDPACPWSWGSEPKLRRLIWEFGDQLRFRWVMGGLARGLEPGDHARLISEWLDVSAETGMPCDPCLWISNPITSTNPACQAVKAACEQGSDAGYRYLRRLREGLLCERKRLDHADALLGEAGPAGLDVARFEIDLRSHAITEAFGADLEEVRTPPAEARKAGQVNDVDGGERVAFPSTLFVAEDGSRHGIYGWQPYDAYRAVASRAGADPGEATRPQPLEIVERFGRVATREVEELTGRPRPVVEADLWALAREWRLRPAPLLTGTLWERP